jgi:hydrogenase maturation factor
MTEPPACRCITCRDEAVEMRILALDADRGLALCEAAGAERRTVDVSLLEHAAAGQAILVHADVALARAADPEPTR